MDRHLQRRWIGLFVSALLAGCAQKDYAESNGASGDYSAGGMASTMPQSQGRAAPGLVGGAPASPESVSDEARSIQPAESPAPSSMEQMADVTPDRYLIKNATITIEAGEVSKAAEALTAAVRAAKGYVSDSHETVDGLGVRSITLQVRIPADRFDGAMAEAQKLGKVLEKQVTAEDVTEEYVDSQSRLRNLRRTEDRLIAHLARTGKLSDTLLVEKELSRVRLEIERLDGRLRFLSHRISFSTITATIQEAPRTTALVPAQSYSTGQVASEASRSLVGFAQSLWSFLIWLAIWAVVWIPVTLLFVWLIRRLQSASVRA